MLRKAQGQLVHPCCEIGVNVVAGSRSERIAIVNTDDAAPVGATHELPYGYPKAIAPILFWGCLTLFRWPDLARNQVLNDLDTIVNPDPPLPKRISVPDGHSVIGQRLAVHSDAEGRADLVLPAIAPTHSALFIIETVDMRF